MLNIILNLIKYKGEYTVDGAALFPNQPSFTKPGDYYDEQAKRRSENLRRTRSGHDHLASERFHFLSEMNKRCRQCISHYNNLKVIL